jgi:hypothetical protein
MINIIHHEEKENGEIVNEYYHISGQKYCNLYCSLIRLSPEELIELRDKLNEMEIKQ